MQGRLQHAGQAAGSMRQQQAGPVSKLSCAPRPHPQVVRTCAAGGRLERAIELLEAMADAGMKSSMASDDDDPVVPPELRIEAITFAAVASECLKAGLGDKAEEVRRGAGAVL